jgi:DNA-binding response OmpR family regulator
VSIEKTAKKVLLLSDNQTVVMLIKHAIVLQGNYRVIVEPDSEHAQESMAVDLPDCIIVDIRPVRMEDNYQFVRHLRSDAHTEHIPLIILSPVRREKDILTEWLVDTDEYLSRPFKPAVLNAALERVLQRLSQE